MGVTGRRYALELGLGLGLGLTALFGVGSADAEKLKIPSTPPALAIGRIVAPGAGSFTASVNAGSGLVTVGGGAVRLGPSTVTTPTITVTCAGPPSNCKNTNYTIQLSHSSSSGGRGGTITSFNISNFSGTGVTLQSQTAVTNGLVLNVRGTENDWSLSFKVGASVTFNAGSASGDTTITYTIFAS